MHFIHPMEMGLELIMIEIGRNVIFCILLLSMIIVSYKDIVLILQELGDPVQVQLFNMESSGPYTLAYSDLVAKGLIVLKQN